MDWVQQKYRSLEYLHLLCRLGLRGHQEGFLFLYKNK